jgi:hypothetical protein
MNCDIRPAAYGIDWRVFPGLETTAVDEIMGGFPVVVDCKSVCCGLDWGHVTFVTISDDGKLRG